LGHGLVLTAAHVAKSFLPTKPNVGIASLEFPGSPIKESPLDQDDLALLSIEASNLPANLQTDRISVCKEPADVGAAVIVVTSDATTRSFVISPARVPPNLREKFGTIISNPPNTGNSGSGVFDAASKCLHGIISRKLQLRGGDDPKAKEAAKYFVPASIIRNFIPSTYGF
jgi:hypothetical protein